MSLLMKYCGLRCQKMQVRGARLKTKEKRKWKHLRVVQLNHWDVLQVSSFTGDGSKTYKGGSQEIKVWKVGEQGIGSRRF